MQIHMFSYLSNVYLGVKLLSVSLIFFSGCKTFLNEKNQYFHYLILAQSPCLVQTSSLTDDWSLTNQSPGLYHRACPISICTYLMRLTPSLFSSLLTCSSWLPHDPIRACPNLPLTPPPSHFSSNQCQVLLDFLKIYFPISIFQLPWSPPYPGPSTLLSGPSEKDIFSIYWLLSTGDSEK